MRHGPESQQRRKPDEIAIGELSHRTGVNVETIRYYERIKVLPPPARTGSGRRVYDLADSRKLAFIRRARELGFALDEVRALLGLVERGYSCGEVQELTRHHLVDIRRKIADLRRMERTLRKTSELCAGGEVPECPIIDVLFGKR